MRLFNKKKQNLFTNFQNLLKSKTSIFFLSVNKLTIKDKMLLKQEFEKQGLSFMVLRNKVFIKQIELNFPKLLNLIPLVQGFCIVIYPKNFEGNITISNLQQLGIFLEKQTDFMFLGGLFENKLVNQTFLKELKHLKNADIVYRNIISVLTSSQQNIYSTLLRPINNLHYTIISASKIDN